MRLLPTLLLVFSAHFSLLAQSEIKYILPPSVVNSDYALSLEDIIADNAQCKLRVVVQNMSNKDYLVYALHKSSFSYEGLGKYYEKKMKCEVVEPLGKLGTTVKVVGNDFRFPAFQFQAEGLYRARPNVEAYSMDPLQITLARNTTLSKDGITVQVLGIEEKKGQMTATIEITVAEGNEQKALYLNTKDFTLSTSSGSTISAEYNFSKPLILCAGDKEKLKITYSTTPIPFNLNWNKGYQLITLEALNPPAIPVSSSVAATPAPAQPAPTPTPPPAKPAPTCNPYMASKDASVKVMLQADEGLCFKLEIDGFPVINDFCSRAIIYREPGRQRFRFIMADGNVVEESSIIANTYSQVGYNLVLKNNGEYAVRYDVGAQTLNEQGEQQRAEMMEDTRNMTNGDNEGSQGNGDNGGAGCFGSPTSGAKVVKVKVTWKGNPVSYTDLQIKQGGAVIAISKTDGSGLAQLKTSTLSGPEIEVQGCKGNTNWSASGSFCVLDGNNYLHLQLDEVAKFVGDMLGKSIDEVGAGWGL